MMSTAWLASRQEQDAAVVLAPCEVSVAKRVSALLPALPPKYLTSSVCWQWLLAPDTISLGASIAAGTLRTTTHDASRYRSSPPSC